MEESMNPDEVIKELKSILCWVSQNSAAYDKIKHLIERMGGKV